MGLRFCSLRLHWVCAMWNDSLSFTCLYYGLAVLRKVVSSCAVEGNVSKVSPVERDCDMRCIQAGELALFTAPDSRWLLVVRLCCPSSPTSVKWGPAFSSTWKSTGSLVLGKRYILF